MSEGLQAKIDVFQRRHRITGFTYAVIKRYYEDHGPWLGSLISYYGFFSLYPAVIVLVTVSTWLFSDRPDVLQRILEALWSRVPFADSTAAKAEVEQRISQFGTNRWVLVVSLLVTLWGALGVVRVLQDGVNTIWGVARFNRPAMPRKILRAFALIVLLGLSLVGSTVVAGISLTAQLPWGGVLLVAIANLALTVGVALAVYHLAIATPVTTRLVLPGAIVIAIGSYIVTLVGGLYVKNVVARMSSPTARSSPSTTGSAASRCSIRQRSNAPHSCSTATASSSCAMRSSANSWSACAGHADQHPRRSDRRSRRKPVRTGADRDGPR